MFALYQNTNVTVSATAFVFKLTVGNDCTGIRNIHSSTHSFRSKSYDRSIASSKSNSPQSVILFFLIMFAVSSPFRKVIQ